MAFNIGRKGEYAEIPEGLAADARKATVDGTGRLTVKGMMRTLAIGPRAAGAIISGGRLPVTVLDEVSRNLYHKEDGSFRVRLLNMLSVSRQEATRTLSKIQHTAELVDRFRDVLRCTDYMKMCWLLPPRDAMRELGMAIDHAYEMLVQMHRECPELDRYVFKRAKTLYGKILEEDSKPRKRRPGRPRKTEDG